MKTISLILIALFIPCAILFGEVETVKFYKGIDFFKRGDSIKIESVESTSEDFETGDIVIVKGHYKLSSHNSAILLLTSSAKDISGNTRIEEAQKLIVQEGKGEFKLKLKIPYEGYLHVSFYPIKKGTIHLNDGFGHAYFGTKDQMKAIEHWNLEIN